MFLADSEGGPVLSSSGRSGDLDATSRDDIVLTMRCIALAMLCAACGNLAKALPDAEALAEYAGTQVVHPHGSMYSQTSAATVFLGTTYAKADDCTLADMSNDAGALSFGVAGSQCTVGHLAVVNGTLGDAMLALHWSKLTFDDELTDYDFSGSRL